jgi:hypothetical protein
MECPNRITPWKCNGPHIEIDKITEKYCKSEYGYFLKKENGQWVFIPFEKELDADVLLNITDMLITLNERENDT